MTIIIVVSMPSCLARKNGDKHDKKDDGDKLIYETTKKDNYFKAILECNCFLDFPDGVRGLKGIYTSETVGKDEVIVVEGKSYTARLHKLIHDAEYSRSYEKYYLDSPDYIFFENGEYIGFDDMFNIHDEKGKTILSEEELKKIATDSLSKYVDLSRLELDDEILNEKGYSVSYRRIIDGVRTTEVAETYVSKYGTVFKLEFHDAGVYTAEIVEKIKKVKKEQVENEFEECLREICDENGITKYNYEINDWYFSMYNNLPMLVIDMKLLGEEGTKPNISLTHKMTFFRFYSDEEMINDDTVAQKPPKANKLNKDTVIYVVSGVIVVSGLTTIGVVLAKSKKRKS